MAVTTQSPSWEQLYQTLETQEGLFSSDQAADAGYSPQLLAHHVKAGRFVRVARRIYRLVHFPPGEHEELVTIWLWLDRAGVFSHETALWRHELSDVLPTKMHLTLPEAWKKRRLRVPKDVALHHAEVRKRERTWFGAVPVTGVARTLNDCAESGLSPELLQQATRQALQRGLVRKSELPAVKKALKPYGGIG